MTLYYTCAARWLIWLYMVLFNTHDLYTGAGNKILTVVNGLSDLYLITTESNVVHRWDTCAGHAMLKVSGGGIIRYKHVLDALSSYKGEWVNFI